MTNIEAYNSNNRGVEMKAVIDIASSPLTVTRDNFISNISILEESHSGGSLPFGEVKSNELSLSLINTDSVFTLTNTASPYYNKFYIGQRISVFIRPMQTIETEPEFAWEPFGVYYLRNLNTSSYGGIATFLAYDKLYDVLNAPLADLPIKKNVSRKSYYEAFFTSFDLTADVDTSLTDQLAFAYIQGDNRSFLRDLGVSCASDCFCKHDGTISVKNLYANRGTEWVLTDDNQIIDARTDIDIVKSYNGISVTVNTPQQSSTQTLVSAQNYIIPKNNYVHPPLELSSDLVYNIQHIRFERASNVQLLSMRLGKKKVYLTTNNTGNALTTNMTIMGSVVESITSIISDETSNLLVVTSPYIQDVVQANKLKAALNKFIVNSVPTIEVDIRGLPPMELGDLVHVHSVAQAIDIHGVLIGAKHEYDGSFMTTLTVMDADMFVETVTQEVK